MADTYYSNVSLLLNFNGADGSTTFTDSGPGAKTLTVNGSAQIDTAHSKFGGASGLFDGASAYLTHAADAAFGFGTGAFTIEAWLRVASLPGYRKTVVDFRTALEAGDIDAVDGEFGFDTDGSLYYFNTDATWYYYPPPPSSPVPTSVQTHIAWTYDGATLRAFVDGVLQWSASTSLDFGASRPLTIGRSADGSQYLDGHLDDLRITNGVCRYTSAFTPPTAELEGGDADPQGYIADAGPLGAPALLGLSGVGGSIADSGPLGAPHIYGLSHYGALTAPSPLGAPALLAWHDFTGHLGDTVTRYAVDLIGESGTVRAPISSWQATLQTDAKCYVQCVIPACAGYVDAITEATAISIKRIAALPDGSTIEYEMAQAPDPTATLSQGPYNYTATVSGYADAFTGDTDPPATYDRALQSVRSLTTTPSSLRARCAIDWLLRPGHRALLSDTQSLVVAFINYYANATDQYMDVGDRTA